MKKIIASLLLIGNIAYAADTNDPIAETTPVIASIKKSEVPSAMAIDVAAWKVALNSTLKSKTYGVERKLDDVNSTLNPWLYALSPLCIPYEGLLMDGSAIRTLQAHMLDLREHIDSRHYKQDFAKAASDLKKQGLEAYGYYISQMQEALPNIPEKMTEFMKYRDLALNYCRSKIDYYLRIVQALDILMPIRRDHLTKILKIEQQLFASQSKLWPVAQRYGTNTIDDIINTREDIRSKAIDQSLNEVLNDTKDSIVKWSLRKQAFSDLKQPQPAA